MVDVFNSKLALLVLQLLAAWNGGGFKSAAARKRALERFLTMKVLAHCLRAVRDGDVGVEPEEIELDGDACTSMATAADALALPTA